MALQVSLLDVLAFLLFVCFHCHLAVWRRLLRGRGGEHLWSVSLKAEPEMDILGKRRIEGVYPEKLSEGMDSAGV